MNRASMVTSILILAGVILSACLPQSITVPIDPPEIGITLVVGTPSGEAPTATPVATDSGETGTSAALILFYGMMVVAGVAVLIALFALLRRPGE